MANWNKRFIELAKHIAGWSKDKSTQTCAIITSKDNRVLSVGYNGFPSGCDDVNMPRYERPKKYLYTEHAERNAIYNAARNGINTNGATMYLMWFPCADCARAVIQSGITRLVCKEPDMNSRWREHFVAAIEMLNECNIKIEYYEDTCSL